MTDKEKLIKIKSLADKMYNAAFNMTTDASLLRKAMDDYHQFIIYKYHKEEPVNKDFEMTLAEMIDKAQKCVVEPLVVAAQWKDELIKLAKCEEPVSEDLGEYINELSKQFPEVSFAKLSRIAVRVAKWNEKQMIAKAINAHVNYAWSSLCFGGFDWSKTGLDIGDKCKLIIIKED